MHPSKGGANPTEPGAATAATLLPGNDPNFVDGPFETHTGIDPAIGAMGLIWAPTLGVVWQRHRDPSRRSSRGQPTQESILGPISITIYISMNNGDSDAMDNRS